YDDLWKLNQIVDALNSENIIPEIIIPCLLDAQADRRFNKGESFNLKLIVKFLDSMNATFNIYRPHNSDALLFGSDKINILDNYSFISNVLSDYKKNNNINNLCLLSPDAGAY